MDRNKLQAAFDKWHKRQEDELHPLAKIKERLLAGEDPTQLMNEMERTFQIPALDDPEFNRQHPEVMKLYRRVAATRDNPRPQKRSQEPEFDR